VKLAGLLLALLPVSVLAGAASSSEEVDAVYPTARALYVSLHQHPELSGHEVHTAATVAGALRKLGYEVTEHVGGTGVVAVLHNGPGPTILLRTELDALPVQERTGLPYASHVRAKDDAGNDVYVGHMCGHDLHMSALVATAQILANTRDSWHGTLELIGQPAEEAIGGASAMVKDGLFTRFPRPDALLALHVGNELPAGQVGVIPGFYDTNSDSVRITIFGRGGHGAMPQKTIDPIVIAARTILALQTIVSREVQPGALAIITVGYVRAGTKNNVIPDQAELGLTVRTREPAVREQLLQAITRVANGEAAASAAPRAPLVEHYESSDAVYNDPALAARMRLVLTAALGRSNVVEQPPITASEDFSAFVEQGIPGFYMALGGADPVRYAQAQHGGEPLPSNHSPLFAPDLDPALHTAIKAEVAMLRALLQPNSRSARGSPLARRRSLRGAILIRRNPARVAGRQSL
jgi:amidohydrolase